MVREHAAAEESARRGRVDDEGKEEGSTRGSLGCY